jgi:hypothetical protein
MFAVRYKLMVFILIGRNPVFKGLNVAAFVDYPFNDIEISQRSSEATSL